ncbi:7729_t:CDS:10 [Funneliformis mosseae]|uniref:DNA mismatch repair protein MSH3 n=1 Tax=Funneliformis mosseae TaxID=27381 RepID=A0A9N9DV50_FUNMO|nr:7729_t:CDS:10 [Funneliformis mosseae]
MSTSHSRKSCDITSTSFSEDSKSSSSLPTRRPRTSTSTRACGRDNHSYMVAVIEGRGVASEIGMCFIDLRTSECILSQFADSQTYIKTLHKLNLYDPSEIVLSQTAFEPSKSKLCKVLEDNIPMASFVPIGRKYFNDVIGLNYIKQAKDESTSLILGIASKHLFLNPFSATAAILKYIESTQNIFFTNHSIKFKYQGNDDDSMTSRNLELISNINNPRSNHSLFVYLFIEVGRLYRLARLLRTNILQPLSDIMTINMRLDAVEGFHFRCMNISYGETPTYNSYLLCTELIRHEACDIDTFFAIQTALKPFQDIDHLITALIQVPKRPSIKYAEQSINNVIMLKHNLRLIQLLKESFTGIQNSLLDAIYELLTDTRLDAFEELINDVINEDITYVKTPLALRNQRCYAVKAGFNGLLDVARQTYKETTQFSSAIGFYLSINNEQLEGRPLPLIFITIKKKKKGQTFTTLEIMKKNTKINDSLTEVYLMSDKIIEDLISEIRGDIGVLYKASESIAMLDMLISFVHQCTVSNYVRPEFTDTLAIKAGRHPMRESLYNDTFVPNDTYASSATSFQLITGPNMSGKSTYLRQIALMSIMSQIGSYVPAEYASFRVADQLFTRICNDDNIENNTSTFVIEMRETAYILQNVTDDSLVIIDELGRGTSTHDGLGITYAICEELLKSKAFIFFATHFHELTRSLTVYPKVVNLHLEVEINEDNRLLAMKYLYRVKDGRNEDEHYGLKFGQIIGLPQEVIRKASEVSHKLQELIDTNKEKSTSNKIIQRRKILLQQLVQHLLQIKRSSNLDKDSLKKYLKMVQEEFIAKMEELF